MADEPVRIEFTTNAPETTAAIESINAALRRIPESGSIAGQGIDSFISRSITALGRLSAEISRVSGELRSLGSAVPGTAGGGVAPVAPPTRPSPATPVGSVQQEMTVDELRSLYGGNIPTSGVSARSGGLNLPDLEQQNATAELARIRKEQADAEAKVAITTSRNAQEQMRMSVSTTRTRELEGGGTVRETDRAVVFDEAARAKQAADAIKAEEQAFNAAAREGDQLDKKLRSLSNAQYEASLKGKPLTEQLRLTEEQMVKVGQASSEQPVLQGRVSGLRAGIASQETKELDAAAVAASRSDKALASFAESEFKGSLKGQDFAAQLAVVRDRLTEVGQADPKRPMLEGLERQLQGRVTQQGYREEDKNIQLLREQARATKDYEPVLNALNDAKKNAAGSTERLTSLQIKEQQVMNELDRTTKNLAGSHQSLGNIFERQIVRIAIGVAVWTTLRTAQQEIQKTIQAMQEYSIEVARFAAITEQSVGAATRQYNELRNAATERGFTPTEAAPAITATARFTKAPEAQQQLFEAGAKLAEFIGAKDPTKVIEKLGESIIATGGDFTTAAQKAEMLAAAFVKSGSSAEQFLDTLSDAAAISEKLGTEYNKTVALIVAGATASGQTAGVAFQSLNRISETFDKMSGEKLSRTVNGFRELGVNVLDSSQKLRSTGDIIEEVGQKFGTWDTSKQEQAISLLFGGETVKGNIRAAGKGLIEAFSQGLVEGFASSENILNDGLSKIEDTFGASIKRIKAQTETLRQEGAVAQAASFDILGTVLPFMGSMVGGAEGGKQAAQKVEGYQQQWTSKPQDAARLDFLKSLYGMTPEEAEKAIDDWNKRARDATAKWRQENFGASLNPFTQNAVNQIELGLIISPEQKAIALKELADIGNQVPTVEIGVKSMLPKYTRENDPMLKRIMSRDAEAPIAPLTPLEEMRSQLRNAPDIGEAAKSIFPTNELDLTKMTIDEINQAKQLSIMISEQELVALRAQLIALGLTKAEIDKIISAQEKELDGTIKLLQTREGLNYEMGKSVANLDKAMNKMQSEKQEKESNFAFQRLRDVDPSQFGQLQALTAMYDAMLTNMGSPKKSKNINLLLGEENVFKTMNARMTALQLALEDLAKVEKAQLSGTWNLPAGATALVPISSLDIQRWNKAEGGGLSAEAIRAMLEATKGAGDQTSTSMQTAATRIIQAIQESAMKAGLPMEKILQAKTPAEAVSSTREALNEKVSGGMEMGNKMWGELYKIMMASFAGGDTRPPVDRARPFEGSQATGAARTRQSLPSDIISLPEKLGNQGTQFPPDLISNLNMFSQMLANNAARMGGGGRGMFMAGGGGGGERLSDTIKQAASATPTTISALPIKAVFNANVSVVLNGQVIARTLQPILYQMIAKLLASTGSRPKGVMR